MAKKAEIEAAVAEVAATEAENMFSKDQLLTAGRYSDKRDLLSTVLADGKSYTIAAVEQLLIDFMEREVK